jgi:hypothetical protein
MPREIGAAIGKTRSMRRDDRVGLVKREKLLSAVQAIEPDLYRYPAIDPAAFRQAVMLHLQ